LPKILLIDKINNENKEVKRDMYRPYFDSLQLYLNNFTYLGLIMTFGAVFQLRGSATSKLENLSTANLGKHLCAKVNGRIVDAVRIDTTVTDGFLVIWNNIQDAEIKEYDKVAPRIGKKKK
jgi:hypothetical protein